MGTAALWGELAEQAVLGIIGVLVLFGVYWGVRRLVNRSRRGAVGDQSQALRHPSLGACEHAGTTPDRNPRPSREVPTNGASLPDTLPDGAVSPALEQLELTHQELDRVNATMWQSIHYARNIQQGALPRLEAPPDGLQDLAADWQPLDVLSGDYYWFESRGDKAIVFVADCTGHGLSAAFMTMMLAGELRDVLDTLPWRSPSELLRRLGERVHFRLHDNGPDANRDGGFDAGLCVIDWATARVLFAGAAVPLVHVARDETTVIRGARVSLGYRCPPWSGQLSDHQRPFVDGDAFYIFTDGVPDHIGEHTGRSFGRSNVVRVLEQSGTEPLRRQLDELNMALLEYRGNETPRDDATIVGFRPASALPHKESNRSSA